MSAKILVATDGSERSMKAVRRAVELAEKEAARVTVMSVAHFVREDFDEMPPDIQDKLEAQAVETLKNAKALFDEKTIPVEVIMEVGMVPANNILERASAGKFDRILLGSTGVTGLAKFFIGSTAAKVVANAHCTVSVIR